MKKIIILFFAVTAIALAGLYAAPYLIDWDAYKGKIATLAEEATGKKLQIENISIAPFPLPKLVITGIRLGDIEGGEQMFAAAGLEASLSPLALVTGNILVTRVFFRDALVSLQFFEEAETGDASVAGLGGVFGAFSVSRIFFQGLAITIASGKREQPVVRELKFITAEFEASSVDGPFALNGQVNSGNVRVPITLNAELGELTGGKMAKLMVQLTAGSSVVELKGEARKQDGRLLSKATFLAKIDASIREVVEGSSLYYSRFSRVLSSMFTQQPTEIKGDFILTEGGVGLENLTFSSESIKGKGKIASVPGALKNIEVWLEFDVLDLDAIVASELAFASKEKLDRAAQVPNTDGAEGMKRFAGDMNFLIDITAKEAKLREQSLQNAHLKMGLIEGNAMIRSLNAQGMPGNTSIAWQELPDTGGWQQATGTINIAGEQLDTFVNWISGKSLLPDAPMFKAFTFNADVNSEATKIRLPRIQFAAGPASIIGQAEIDRKQEVFVNSAFHINRIVLDDYWDVLKKGKGPRLSGEKKLLIDLSNVGLLFDKLNALIHVDNIQFKTNDYVDFSGLIELAPDHFDLTNIAVASSPFGRIAGEIRIPIEILKPHPQLDFAIEKFETTSFTSSTAAAEKTAEADASSGGVWSEAPFDFSVLELLEKGKLHITIGQFQHQDIVMEHVDSTVELIDNKIIIPDTKADVFDSKLLLTEGMVTLGERPAIRFAFDIANADIKRVLESFVGYTVINGRGSITGSIAMSGQNLREWISSLEGSARLYTRAVTVKGMDFELLARKMVELRELEEVRYWSHRALTTGKYYMDFLTASVSIRTGKLIFENIAATQGFILKYDVKLAVDLPSWQLDGRINLALKPPIVRNDAIPVDITIAGSLTNPYITWDKSLYEKYWENKYFRRY